MPLSRFLGSVGLLLLLSGFLAPAFRGTVTVDPPGVGSDALPLERHPAPVETTLVPMGSVWRYLDDGTDQGTAWRAPGFDDSGWAAGPAQLGFGEEDEATVVSFGPDPDNKYVTTYFRHTFQVDDASAVLGARLELLRDDSAVVYLNGVEVDRSNLPDGALDYLTVAIRGLARPEEKWIQPIDVDVGLLSTGTNVLAVEVHQNAGGSSSDLSFDLSLTVSDTLSITRGPYLQLGTPTSAVVRWRTSAPADSVAWLGTSVGALAQVVSDPIATTEHEVAISNLTPDSQYFYAVGNSSGILAGDDQDHRFTTAPEIGTAKPTRIWVIGDSGFPTPDPRAVRDAYIAHPGSQDTDVWLMMGDNAYYIGLDSEFQSGFFDLYPTMLRNTFVWPTFGNHDRYSADSDSESGVYYDIVTLPRQGEAGGVASGTEAYYSFDYGDIHFICLDSADTNLSPNGDMMEWLEDDLAQTSATWLIAFWHHPPYTKGWQEDSDNPDGTNGLSEQMREVFVPVLEAAGVDLVLGGHAHAYERSMLLDGHYGISTTLTPAMKLDSGDGSELGDGAYAKPSPGQAPNEGTVYAVVGSSGEVTNGPLNHPVMITSMATLGSMVIDIDGNRLDAKYLDVNGDVLDEFTLLKGVTRSLTRDEPRISLSAGGAQNFFLDAGPEHAGRPYLLAGAFGTSPGFDMGLVHVPLNVDPWLDVSLRAVNSSYYPNTSGVLDENGRAQAAFVVPVMTDPSAIGLVLHHAYVVYEIPLLLFASNPVRVTMIQ